MHTNPAYFRRKPGGVPTIRKDTSLTQDLFFDAGLLGTGTVSPQFKTPTIIGSTPLNGAGHDGIASRFDTTDRAYSWGIGAVNGGALEWWTIVVEATRIGTVSATGYVFAVGRSDSDDYNVNIYCVATTHVMGWRYRLTSDQGSPTANTATWGLGQRRQVAMVINGNADRKLFVDGVLDSSSVDDMAATYPTTAVSRVRIGRLARSDDSGTNCHNFNVHSARIWNRALSINELKLLREAPSRIYTPYTTGKKYFLTNTDGGPAASTISSAMLPAGLGAMGSGQTRAILPSGLGNMG